MRSANTRPRAGAPIRRAERGRVDGCSAQRQNRTADTRIFKNFGSRHIASQNQTFRAFQGSGRRKFAAGIGPNRQTSYSRATAKVRLPGPNIVAADEKSRRRVPLRAAGRLTRARPKQGSQPQQREQKRPLNYVTVEGDAFQPRNNS
jgi:hypothetical protein